MKERFGYTNTPLITIEPKTPEDFFQVVKDCHYEDKNDPIGMVARLHYYQRCLGPLKGERFGAVAASTVFEDPENEDYDFFLGHLPKFS